MARGGVNKATVKSARDSVLSKGQNPSIDAVRIALGNTGSKTTIHRYLKDIEQEESVRLDDHTLLSDTLKDMVARLASQLQEEAQYSITQIQEKHAHQITTFENQLKENKQALLQTEAHEHDQTTKIDTLQARLDETFTANQTLNIQLERLTQQVNDLEHAAQERQKHIHSLEEKHQHNREAMAHYRQSVKDQREQDQRNFEQQLQLAHTEKRQANELLMIKQGEASKFTSDNARLATELTEVRKNVRNLESKIHEKESDLMKVSGALTLKTKELESLQETLLTANGDLKRLTVELDGAKDETRKHEKAKEEALIELHIKSEVLDKIAPISTPKNAK